MNDEVLPSSEEQEEHMSQVDQSLVFLMDIVKNTDSESASTVWAAMHEYAKCKGNSCRYTCKYPCICTISNL